MSCNVFAILSNADERKLSPLLPAPRAVDWVFLSRHQPKSLALRLHFYRDMKLTLLSFLSALLLISACGTQCPAGTTQSGDFCLSSGGTPSTVGGAIYPYCPTKNSTLQRTLPGVE
jgi:hypothetical protein